MVRLTEPKKTVFHGSNNKTNQTSGYLLTDERLKSILYSSTCRSINSMLFGWKLSATRAVGLQVVEKKTKVQPVEHTAAVLRATFDQ